MRKRLVTHGTVRCSYWLCSFDVDNDNDVHDVDDDDDDDDGGGGGGKGNVSSNEATTRRTSRKQ